MRILKLRRRPKSSYQASGHRAVLSIIENRMSEGIILEDDPQDGLVREFLSRPGFLRFALQHAKLSLRTAHALLSFLYNVTINYALDASGAKRSRAFGRTLLRLHPKDPYTREMLREDGTFS